MKYEFGFIGVGNMGGAIADAVCRTLSRGSVAVCDTDQNKTGAFQRNTAPPSFRLMRSPLPAASSSSG